MLGGELEEEFGGVLGGFEFGGKLFPREFEFGDDFEFESGGKLVDGVE